jgi:HlyD family secretion protein
VLGSGPEQLAVRCYVDEILINRLADLHRLKARMFVRGTKIEAPLEFIRVQPYVSPKIQLSDQRTERVDVRVLPVIFRIGQPKGVRLYPGQMVDVYIAAE